MTTQEAVALVKTVPNAVPNPNKKSFILVWVLIFLLSVFYALFVNQTVMNIVERQSIEKEMAALESRVGNLEFEFIAKKNEINLDYAYAQGFEDILDTRYIARGDDGSRLTLRNVSYEEIQ